MDHAITDVKSVYLFKMFVIFRDTFIHLIICPEAQFARELN